MEPRDEIVLQVLLAEDSPQHAELAQLELEGDGMHCLVAGSAEEAIRVLESAAIDVLLSDYHLPGLSGMGLLQHAREHFPEVPVILVTGMGSEQIAVAAMKAGAEDYLIKDSRLGYLQMLPTVVRRAYEKHRLALEVARLRRQVSERHRFDRILGASPAMQEVFRLLDAIVPSNATVLVSGESGTGKELVARAIHSCGPRASGPFIACNCGAIPEHLLESELFGHERGAFTGAVQRRTGAFESAHRGTLFLDEVSELSASGQVALLRAVQERRIVRVGSSQSIPVDVRIIAAGNRNLWDLVRNGEFREDLYYRLNVLSMALPPLRERAGDVLLLADQFLKRFREETGKAVSGFAPAALKLMEAYAWPGNIRELEHAVQRAVILSQSPAIEVADLPPALSGGGPAAAAPTRTNWNLEENERQMIQDALSASFHNISRAARLLGVTRSTLYSKLERYGIKAPDSGHPASEPKPSR